MSALIPATPKKVTSIPAMNLGEIGVTGTLIGGTLGSLLMELIGVGVYNFPMISAGVLGTGAVATTFFASRHNLRKGYRKEWELTGKKPSVFAFLGKDKIYSLSKKDANGKTIEASLIIGKGSATLVEAVKPDPIDVWDTSIAAVRNLYKLDRGSYKEKLALEKDATPKGLQHYHTMRDGGWLREYGILNDDHFNEWDNDDPYDDEFLDLAYQEHLEELEELETKKRKERCQHDIMKKKRAKYEQQNISYDPYF